jgi:hypothetical protein
MAYDVLVVPVDDHFLVSCVDYVDCPKCGARNLFVLAAHCVDSSRWRFADTLFCDCSKDVFTPADFKHAADHMKGWSYVPDAMTEFDMARYFDSVDLHVKQFETLSLLGLFGSTTGEEFECF